MENQLFLCYYAQQFEGFRLAELEAICDLFEIPLIFDKISYSDLKPFVVLSLPDKESARKILSRSVLIKFIVELWANVTSIHEMEIEKSELQTKADKMFESDSSPYRIDVDSYNKKISLPEKIKWIENIQQYITFHNPLDLNKPSHILNCILDFGCKDTPTENCLNIFFGRFVGHSQRQHLLKYSLKSRHFIGNTSMDPQLSMLMANQAQATAAKLIYDPFVGTGSVLVACAHFNAKTAGSDIDHNIIYGRGRSSRANKKGFRERDEIIRTNYEKYGLQHCYIDVIAADVTRMPYRNDIKFDAIVTDPPYGIREGGRRSGPQNKNADSLIEASSIATTTLHELPDIMDDLFTFADNHLIINGRLVFWMPVHIPSYTDESVPNHPSFKLISNCEQRLSATIARRLITMEKITADLSISITNKSPAWRQQQREFRDNYFKIKQ